jgi:hypothetical protein
MPYNRTEKREYAMGTYLEVLYPFGQYIGGKAMCSDGKVRKLIRISETADTFFSVPAAVKVGTKKVSGFITVDDKMFDKVYVRFVAVKSGKNHNLLPEW